MKRIAVFDFDGTITCKDTLIAFLRFVGGNIHLYMILLYYSPLLILMKLRLYDNQKVKEKIFTHYFCGMDIDIFECLCKQFYQQYRTRLIYTQAREQIQKHKDQGDIVVIITASIENWVIYFANALDVDKLLATQLEVQNNKLTGRFKTVNCWGQEKVNRLLYEYSDRCQYYIVAYGDSRGDNELLQFADEAHYKQFKK